MKYYQLKHICGNDLKKIIDDGNQISLNLSDKGHEIIKIDVYFDKDSIHHNRKASHSVIIHYCTH